MLAHGELAQRLHDAERDGVGGGGGVAGDEVAVAGDDDGGADHDVDAREGVAIFVEEGLFFFVAVVKLQRGDREGWAVNANAEGVHGCGLLVRCYREEREGEGKYLGSWLRENCRWGCWACGRSSGLGQLGSGGWAAQFLRVVVVCWFGTVLLAGLGAQQTAGLEADAAEPDRHFVVVETSWMQGYLDLTKFVDK